MKKILLASSNPGKLKEIQSILANVEILPQSAFGISEPEENGSTFVENALIKARNASKVTGLPVIADDSGLVVDVLNGEPGLYSARYAGPNACDQENNQKLLSMLEGITEDKRTARFICILVFLQHENDPLPVIAQGIWEGKILTQSQGTNGFGYDPLFWIPELNSTAAELSLDQKNQLSHRSKALRILKETLTF